MPELPDRISIDETFQRFLPRYDGAGPLAREQLDRALRLGGGVPGGVQLWAGDTAVDSEWYAQHMRVAAWGVEGRWHAELEPSGLRPVGPGPYQWSVSEQDVTALMTSTSVAEHEPELSTHVRRGRKPHHDWELYKAKFYLMLYEDDVPAYADINVSDHADRLMTWGRNNFDKSPEQAAMRGKVAEWKPLWQRLKGADK
jgi:hypothetical protein